MLTGLHLLWHVMARKGSKWATLATQNDQGRGAVSERSADCHRASTRSDTRGQTATNTAPTTFEAKADANEFLSRQQINIIDGKWKPAPDAVTPREVLTLAAYANPWLADRDLKPRTRALYRNLLDRRILPALGIKPLAGLTAADIRSWHADQSGDMPTARAHAYALLRTILGSAVLDGLLPANPCHIRGASGTTRRHRIEPASMAQLEMIMDTMPDRYRLMILGLPKALGAGA